MEVRMYIPDNRDRVLALINQLKSKEPGTAGMSRITLPEAFKEYCKTKKALSSYYNLLHGSYISVSSARALVKAFDTYDEAKAVYQHVQDRYIKLRQKLKELKPAKVTTDRETVWMDFGKTVSLLEGAFHLILERGRLPDQVSLKLSNGLAPYLEAGFSVEMRLVDGKPFLVLTFAEAQEWSLDVHEARSLLLDSVLKKRLVGFASLDELTRR